MSIIQVTMDNLDREHICCAIAAKKDDPAVQAKKAWLSGRFAEGLVFRKLDARGKVFIEYIPAENAWCPIQADGYLHINCLWVSGQFKSKGYGNELFAACLADAKAQGKAGLTALSSKKKRPFLSEPGFLRHKGFRVADTASPYFELLYLPLVDGAPVPSFRPCCKEGRVPEQGMALYYTDQCPFAGKYAEMIQGVAAARGETLALHKMETTEQAQTAPSPFTTYSFFDHGRFVTNEILSEPKFIAHLNARGC